MGTAARTSVPATRRIAAAAEIATATLGGGLILLAVLANRAWLDQHVLPHIFLQQNEQLLWWLAERALALLAGLLLLFPLRRRIGRLVRAGEGGELALQLGLAVGSVLVALLVSEIVLRTAGWARVERWAASEEPLRRPDPLLGWVNVPGRIGFEHFGGRLIRYDMDGAGRRVADLHRELDPNRPSILFVGESIMEGFRLDWPETAAARTEAATGLQSVNLAVNGYGTDQELMRLRQELPRFARPVAVVALFAPTLLERSLDPGRPHLDAGLNWHAARPSWRLHLVTRNLLLYHSTAAIDQAIAATRASLVGIVAAARERRAAALIVVPEFEAEQPAERRIRERVLAGLPYVCVAIDPRWRIPGDGHPNARGNDAMSRAIVTALSAGHLLRPMEVIRLNPDPAARH